MQPITRTTSTNGTYVFTNILYGIYTLTIQGNPPSVYQLVVGTNLSGTVAVPVLVTNLATNLPPNPLTNYYTQANVDALLAGLVGGGGGPVDLTQLITNALSALSIKSGAFVTNLLSTNGTNNGTPIGNVLSNYTSPLFLSNNASIFVGSNIVAQNTVVAGSGGVSSGGTVQGTELSASSGSVFAAQNVNAETGVFQIGLGPTSGIGGNGGTLYGPVASQTIAGGIVTGIDTNASDARAALGIGAIATNSTLDEVDVKQFGAKGDGVTDDTSAITNALATTNIFFPPGKYVANAQLPVPSNRRITGLPGAILFAAANRNYTNSTNPTNATFFVNQHVGTGTIDSNITIEGFLLDGNSPNQSYNNSASVQYAGGSGMRFFGVNNLTINSMTLTNMVGFNIQVGAVTNLVAAHNTFLFTTNFPHQDCWHINGPDAHVRITDSRRNAGNDDFVALNADDDTYGLMSEGTLSDVVIDGVYCDGPSPYQGSAGVGGSAVHILVGTYGETNISVRGVRGWFGNSQSSVIYIDAEIDELPLLNPIQGLTVQDCFTYALPGCPGFLNNSAWLTGIEVNNIHHRVDNTTDGFVGWGNAQPTTNVSFDNIVIENGGGTNILAGYNNPFMFTSVAITNLSLAHVTLLRNATNTAGGVLLAFGPVTSNFVNSLSLDDINSKAAPLFLSQYPFNTIGTITAHGVDNGLYLGSPYDWFANQVYAGTTLSGYDYMNNMRMAGTLNFGLGAGPSIFDSSGLLAMNTGGSGLFVYSSTVAPTLYVDTSGNTQVGGTLHVAGNLTSPTANIATSKVGGIGVTNLTASRLLVSDGASPPNITNNAVTTTEASYLSGVTSAIQTQLNSKGTGNGSVTSVTFTGDGTVLSSTPSSAVATSGTLTASLANATANTVLAGPSSGSAAAPTYQNAPTFNGANISNIPSASLTGLTTNGLVVVTTNWALNTTYNGVANSGMIVTAQGSLATAAVTGDANIAMVVLSTITNNYGIGTTAAVTLAMSYTNAVVGMIPPGGSFYFTNNSVGAGNSSAVAQGQYAYNNSLTVASSGSYTSLTVSNLTLTGPTTNIGTFTGTTNTTNINFASGTNNWYLPMQSQTQTYFLSNGVDNTWYSLYFDITNNCTYTLAVPSGSILVGVAGLHTNTPATNALSLVTVHCFVHNGTNFYDANWLDNIHP